MKFRLMAKRAVYDAVLQMYDFADESLGKEYRGDNEEFTPAQLRDFKYALAKEINRLGAALEKLGVRTYRLPERRKHVELPPSRPEGL